MATQLDKIISWYRADLTRLEMEPGDALDAIEQVVDGERSSLRRNARVARSAIEAFSNTAPAPELKAKPPGMTLGREPEPEAEREAEPVDLDTDEPTTDRWSYDAEAGEYVFMIKGDAFDMPASEVQDLVWWYVRSAGNSTQREVTRRAQIEHGRTLTRDYLRRMLLSLGITKDCPPWAPHMLSRYTSGDLSKLKYQRLQAEAEHVDTREAAREYRGLWRKAEQRAAEVDARAAALVEALASRPVTPLPRVDVAHTSALAVIALYDAHIGKRDVEGGGLEHTVSTVVDATRRLAGRLIALGAPERVAIAVGGDFVHIDNDGSTTTAGTPQDTDASPSCILAAAIDCLVAVVEVMAQVADVELVVIPGNHDRILASAVMLALAQRYRESERVDVRVHHSTRAYLRWGACLLGFEHGDGPKVGDLGPLMASEQASAWGATRHRFWTVGHLHSVHEREVNGVHVLQAPSLAGADRWHHRKGYTTSTRAMRAYLYDKAEGMVATVQAGA